ncbi:hypothetical protein V8D89_004753 [Ganoderma adspersum]
MVDTAIFRGQRTGGGGSFSWFDQVVPVEFVPPVAGGDPFSLDLALHEDEEELVKAAQARSFSQLSTTAELLFAAQHRVALFMIFVVGRKLRFLRWDRAGLIITPAIDFYEDHATLCDFLWRVSHVDDAALGFDPSATRVLPGSPDFLQMDSAARTDADDVDHTERDLGAGKLEESFVFEYTRTSFRESLDGDWPRYRLEVSSGNVPRYYLVGKPAFRADSMVGRGTRGYVALDEQTGRFAWLKDVWRMSYVAGEREGDVLQRINLAGIDGVPTLVCHGDVLEQVTIASDWSSSPSPSSTGPSPAPTRSNGPLPRHTHYRIVVEEVCLPLEGFKTGKQLVSLVMDALRTHSRVATGLQTRLLHCDVSSGNIMIHPRVKYNDDGSSAMVWTGILTDWELSKSVEDQTVPSKATQALRLGTYQFMSVNLLQYLSRPVKVSDELESFFHVLLYYSVRHLRSNCDHTASWVTNYFDRYAGPEKMHTCGQKSVTIESTGTLETLYPPGPLLFNSPMDELFYTALQSFKAHYKVMEHEHRRSSRRPPPPPPSVPTVPVDAGKPRFGGRNYKVNEALRAKLLAEQAIERPFDRSPTAEERELASKVADHTFMIAHLEEYLQDPRWSDDDRIPQAPPRPSPSSSGCAQPTTNTPAKSNANAKVAETGKRRRHEESLGSSNGDRAAKRQRTTKPTPVTAINGIDLAPGSTSSRYTPHFDPTLDKTTLHDSTAIFRAAHVPSEGQPQWSDLSVAVEVFTHRRGIDPFDNTGSQDYGSIERSRQRIPDHISSVADLLFAAQHRVFLFMCLIIGRRFRFLRLDRAGIVATPSIDYYADPHVLCDILWRVSQLDDMALGLDPTATRVMPGDVDFFRMDFLALSSPSDLDDAERLVEEVDPRCPPVFRYVRSLFAESLARDWPRHRVQVRDEEETRGYLVGKPSFRSGEFMGRGTCGYVAYDCKTHRFVWLKDAWRASYMLSQTEGDVLRKLNAANVPNVPTLVCDGDVGEQCTLTADWWEHQHCGPSTPALPPPSPPSNSSSTTLVSYASPGSKKRRRAVESENVTRASLQSPNATLHSNCPLRQHRHYRIVVEEVCMPLKTFKHGRQLVSIVLDCLHAHHQAATHPETRLLHCDISGGNILICPKIRRDRKGTNTMVVWTGILSDWELSKAVDSQDAASKATQADRMGTYEFMSINLLNHITKPVKISDELESFFHLLVYYSVRYLNSNCHNITSWVDNYFHSYSGPERMLSCGEKSCAVEVSGVLQMRYPDGAPLSFRSPMDSVLAPILKRLRAHYKVMEYDATEARPPPCPETPPRLASTAPPVLLRDYDDEDDEDVDEAEIAEWEAELQAGPPDRSPTAEDRELATKVADHKFMLDHLSRMLRDPRWRANDRIPRPAIPQNKLPSTPTGEIQPRKPVSPRSNKRQRTSGTERNASLPARLHTSTRRTRTHARTHPIRAKR